MMLQEFELLYGSEVDAEAYRTIIEPMYYATNLSKADFVALLDKKAFALPHVESETEKQCKAELEIVKDAILWYKERAKLMRLYIKDEDNAERLKSWKETYKGYQQELKRLKDREYRLKFVLDLTI